MKRSPQTFTVNGHRIAVGDAVTAEVVWKDGRQTTMTGTLITVAGDNVYLDTSLGPVEASADTVEPA